LSARIGPFFGNRRFSCSAPVQRSSCGNASGFCRFFFPLNTVVHSVSTLTLTPSIFHSSGNFWGGSGQHWQKQRSAWSRYLQGHALISSSPSSSCWTRRRPTLAGLLAFLSEDENLRLTTHVAQPADCRRCFTHEQQTTTFSNVSTQDLPGRKPFKRLSLEKRQHVVPHYPARKDAVRWLELGKIWRVCHV